MTRKTSDAQMEAVRRYRKKNKDRIHKVAFEIYDSKEPELWQWLDTRSEPKGTAMRRLIREEIERTGWKLGDE
jgi:hypothetical protein